MAAGEPVSVICVDCGLLVSAWTEHDVFGLKCNVCAACEAAAAAVPADVPPVAGIVVNGEAA